MIDIVFSRYPNGSHIATLQCSGHAGFDDGEGLDLVCAAVSALTGALGLGLTEKIQPPLQVMVGDGHFSLDLRPQQVNPPAHLLVDTITFSLIQLAQNYPGFCSVREQKLEEVADIGKRKA